MHGEDASEYMEDHICGTAKKNMKIRFTITIMHNAICEIKVIYSLVFLTIYECITNSQCDQFSVGLKAQLLEHCSGIAEIPGSRRSAVQA